MRGCQKGINGDLVHRFARRLRAVQQWIRSGTSAISHDPWGEDKQDRLQPRFNELKRPDDLRHSLAGHVLKGAGLVDACECQVGCGLCGAAGGDLLDPFTLI